MRDVSADALILPISPEGFRTWAERLREDLKASSYAPISRAMGYAPAKRGGAEDKSTAPAFAALLKTGVQQARVLNRMIEAERLLRPSALEPTAFAAPQEAPSGYIMDELERMAERIGSLNIAMKELQSALEAEQNANREIARRLEQTDQRLQGALRAIASHPAASTSAQAPSPAALSKELKKQKEPWRYLPSQILDLVKLAVQSFQNAAQEAEAEAAGVSSFMKPRWLAWRWLTEPDRRTQHPIHERYAAEAKEALQDFEAWASGWKPPGAVSPNPAQKIVEGENDDAV